MIVFVERKEKMKKRFLATKMLALVLGSMMIFTACGEKKEEAEVKEEKVSEEESTQEIELSESKVTLEVGDDFDIEIENFDDLKKVKVEVEDEDIATAELDDETITIHAYAEGKTTLTVSAKGCEDVTVSIKVKEGEAPASASIDAGRYVATYFIPDSVWEESMGEDGEIFLELFGSQIFSLDFIMDIESDGTAVLSADYDKFVDDFIDWLDLNYIDVMKKAYESEGEKWSDDVEDYLLENKDYMMDSFRESMEYSMTGSDTELAKLTWEMNKDQICFTGDNGVEKRCDVFSDGSFLLSLTADEIGEDMFGESFDLYFYK